MAYVNQDTFGNLDWKVVDPHTLNDNLAGKTIIRVEPMGAVPGIPLEGVIFYVQDQWGNVMGIQVGASEFDTASEFPVLVSAAKVEQ
ncbi:MAG: hypothetical protein ACI4MJ_05130 [Aristaeellaceae bacterium]